MDFYVYALIDPRDGAIFYVGKGRGDRITQHVRNAKAGRIDNAEKHRRIQAILDDGHTVIEQIVSRHSAEADALAAERAAIAAKRAQLTNIVGGSRTNAQINVERAKHWLGRMKTLEHWERTITPRQREAIEAVDGSLMASHARSRAFWLRMVAVSGGA